MALEDIAEALLEQALNILNFDATKIPAHEQGQRNALASALIDLADLCNPALEVANP